MENVVDALKMAGSILLFTIALSVAVLAFSQARETIGTVLQNSDREYLTIEGDERFYYLSDGNDTNRYVGLETIIPAIYRAYKENYRIEFDWGSLDNYYLFKNINQTTGQEIPDEINYIDLSAQNLSGDEKSRKFVEGILYGVNSSDMDEYKERFNVNLYGNGGSSLQKHLTSILQEGYNIREDLGTYYMEDLNGYEETTYNPENGQPEQQGEISDNNKTPKRLIRYTVEPRTTT